MIRPTPEEIGRALDQHTLLPDEDPSTEYLEDALHWILVYSELIQFKETMLASAASASEGLTPAARQDIAIDQVLLRAQADRYRARSAFWYERAATLTDRNSHGATTP